MQSSDLYWIVIASKLSKEEVSCYRCGESLPLKLIRPRLCPLVVMNSNLPGMVRLKGTSLKCIPILRG